MLSKFNSAKCETTCRLGIARIKLMKNKKTLQVKQYRKEIADLLRSGKQDYARIRVEAILRENAAMQAYELLELYLELVAVRGPLIASSKELPRDMIEAISSIVYASSRVPDLPELATLHKMFGSKYGKEYVTEAAADGTCARWMVNAKLRHFVTVEPPEPAAKLEALSDVAQEYGIEWDIDRARRELLPPDNPTPDYAVQQLGFVHAPTQPGYAPPEPQHSYAPSEPAPASPTHMGAPPPRTPPPGEPRPPPGGGGGSVLPSVFAYDTGSSGSRHSGLLPPATPAGAPAPPPPQGWLMQQSPVVAAAPQSRNAGATPAAPPPAAMPAAPGPFRAQSAEEVQAAYDAAQGPPPKPGKAPASTSSAPAALPQPPRAPSQELPSVPGSSAAAAATEEDDEFEQLQRRFEMLKRGA